MVKRHRYKAAPVISVLNQLNLSQLRVFQLFCIKLSNAPSDNPWIMENLEQLHIHNGGNVDRLIDVLGERLPNNTWPAENSTYLQSQTEPHCLNRIFSRWWEADMIEKGHDIYHPPCPNRLESSASTVLRTSLISMEKRRSCEL
ncbi:hypothetical protein FRC03_004851 [Tulasnella sp. 419]|nr:hypothetical protein FRC03_004851 [Tulasnella sp. 419]